MQRPIVITITPRRQLIAGGMIGAVLAASLYGIAPWASLLPRSVQQKLEHYKPSPAAAVSAYTATAGSLVVGTENPSIGNAASGNVGSWRGTLTSDNFYWRASSTASGLDQQVYLDGTELNNANKFIITIEALTNNTTLNRFYQICDWVSSTSVANAADAQCTTGGWRNLNIRNVAITATAETAYTWHIYNGYWNTAPTSTSNTALNTPLSNFINSSTGRVIVRSYSPTSCAGTCLQSLDTVLVRAVIDPVYFPTSATLVNASTSFANTTYLNAENGVLTGQSGSDNVYLTASSTAASSTDFYMSFNNIRTYTGMNTIVVRAEYSCSTTGINHRPKIWNFNSSTWEDLTSATIACSATDATSAWAKNNVTISNYVSGNEVRIGWRGLANGTQAIRIDMIYIMLGSVNSDSAQCEISFGTGTATNCTNTRDVDTRIATSSWQLTTAAESTNMAATYYALDNDGDATSAEHAAAGNVWLPATVPTPALVTGVAYATQWRSSSTLVTTRGQFKDDSGLNQLTSGGWVDFGATNASATYTWQDALTNGYAVNNPEDFFDTTNNRINVRMRTSASTATTSVVTDIDFVFASIQWAETTPSTYLLDPQEVVATGTLVTGTAPNITSGAASGNTGSWKGVLNSDNFYWQASSTASGLDQQVRIDNVDLNNANKLNITYEAGSNSATLVRYYEICDWVSSTSVSRAADAQCTVGGWRMLNRLSGGLTNTTDARFIWPIYNGYWNTSATTTSNTALNTPLSNFISSSTKSVLIRAFSATNCTTCVHSIDYVRIDTVIDPVYFPAGATAVNPSTTFSNTIYRNTNTMGAGPQTSSDNVYFTASSTLTSSTLFYFSFNNVRTYTGANTILVRAEWSCQTGVGGVRPQIWNFASSTWDVISSTDSTCSTTDATSTWAVPVNNMNDYISSGEIRVGWKEGTVPLAANAFRIDTLYMMIGSTNTNTPCEYTFGTAGTSCNNASTYDQTTFSPTSGWQITPTAESASSSAQFYGFDNDADAVTGEFIHAANFNVTSSLPNNAMLTGLVWAITANVPVATTNVQTQIRDYSGAIAALGGWVTLATTTATTLTYADSITAAYNYQTPAHYLDNYNDRLNIRVRTNVATATTSPGVANFDLIFTSLQWAESNVTPQITLTIDTSTVAFGNFTPGTPLTATSTLNVLATSTNSGYVIKINRNNNPTSTLVHTDTVTVIPDYASWDPSGSGNATTTPGATLAFRVSSSTANFNSTWWGTSGSPQFGGHPTTSQNIVSCPSCTNGLTTSTVTYRLDTPPTQKTGAYTGGVTFTAVSNP